MRVMGVDPGLVATGYGVVESGPHGIKVLEAGLIRTSSADPLEKRLLELHNEINLILRENDPGVMVVEELYSTYKHPTTAILMGHARGVIYFAAARHSIPVVSYSATRVKKSLTGNGRASKEQVRRMLQNTLGLKGFPESTHVADALAISFCHLNAVQHRLGDPS